MRIKFIEFFEFIEFVELNRMPDTGRLKAKGQRLKVKGCRHRA